jgi:hypothetical protein
VVFLRDRQAFENPGSENEHFQIDPPNGVTQEDFDRKVTERGDDYRVENYDALAGPNSNTAADNILERGGGHVPNVPGALGQNWGE